MVKGRPKAALVLNLQRRKQLGILASSRSLPAGLVRRARIILLSALGKTNNHANAFTGQDTSIPAENRRNRKGDQAEPHAHPPNPVSIHVYVTKSISTPFEFPDSELASPLRARSWDLLLHSH